MKNDYSWVRWNRLRWQLVEAMITATGHIDKESRFLCTCEHCVDLARLFHVMGIDQDPIAFTHLPRFQEMVTGSMRDGMDMVSTYISFGSGHPLEGFMEVPEAVGEVIHSPYFARGAHDGPVHSTHEPSDETRELLFAFVSLAFPDDYLELVHGARDHMVEDDIDTQSEFDEKIIHGWDANAEFTRQLEKTGLVAPLLSTGMIENLEAALDPFRGVGTWHFWSHRCGSPWYLGAGYSLEMGMADPSLARYWLDFPSIPDAFEYSEHSNQNGDGLGFLARSPGLFVSQQVWLSGAQTPWNVCTTSFNKYLARILENSGPEGAAMVIFSDYREDAYIVSCVEESWDEYAPNSAVMGPLPEGFGIVGVWDGYDENRYTPRSLDDVIAADWSEQITASARYLRDCLAATARPVSD